MDGIARLLVFFVTNCLLYFLRVGRHPHHMERVRTTDPQTGLSIPSVRGAPPCPFSVRRQQAVLGRLWCSCLLGETRVQLGTTPIRMCTKQSVGPGSWDLFTRIPSTAEVSRNRTCPGPYQRPFLPGPKAPSTFLPTGLC